MDWAKKEHIKKLVARAGIIPSSDLGRLCEQYIEVIFKDFKIKKNEEIEGQPNPDYNIIVNEKKYILENKALDNIYSDMFLIFEKLGSKGIELLENYRVSMSPLNIHKNDFEILKKQFSSFLDAGIIENREFLVNGKKYAFNFEKKENPLKGLRTISGIVKKSESNFINLLEDNKKQFSKSYILSVINLNESIDEDDIIFQVYRLIGIATDINSETNISFGQLRKNVFNKFCNLKCIIVFFPNQYKVIICPSTYEFENFNAGTYMQIKKILEKNNLNVKIASLEVVINEIKN